MNMLILRNLPYAGHWYWNIVFKCVVGHIRVDTGYINIDRRPTIGIRPIVNHNSLNKMLIEEGITLVEKGVHNEEGEGLYPNLTYSEKIHMLWGLKKICLFFEGGGGVFSSPYISLFIQI